MPVKILRFIALLVSATVLSIPTHAQDAASAKAFLISVYSHYQNKGRGVEFYGPHASLYFHSSLLALEHADVTANGPDNVPAVDADPVCGCQDYGGIWDLAIAVQTESPQRAKATVSFSVFDPKDQPDEKPTRLIITLVVEHGAWRIWDILDDSDPKMIVSVRKLLQDDLAQLKKNPAPASPKP